MKTAHAWLLLSALGLLPACATLDQDECRNANWYNVGASDGRQGEPVGLLDKHRKACAKYAIQPREEEYLAGRGAGLREYCQIDNAFVAGLNGRSYQGVCPPPTDLAFRRYNAAAYEVYRLRREIVSVDDRLYDRERRLEDRKQSLEERHRLRDEIRDLDRRRDQLRSELRTAELILDRMIDEARQIERGVR